MRFLTQFRSIRFYALFMTALLGLFAWAQFKGVKLIGDDDRARESHKERGAYYHK
jgi:hypothetical protein